MAVPVAHLSVSELEERFIACGDVRTARQTQAIWLLAKGHSFAEAAAATAFSERWVCISIEADPRNKTIINI